MSKVVVVLSGGMDSTVLLHHHLNTGDDVRAFSVDYGQRHGKELEFAKETCNRLSVPWVIGNFRRIAEILPGSSQTDDSVDVPEGHYAEDSMKLTVVPNRNMILLALAAGHAIAHKFDHITYAAHTGDRAVYPDCRPEFYEKLDEVIRIADWHPVSLIAPFGKMTKADIAREGARLGVDFSKTWSCYVGKQHHCGRCGTCVERRESFHLAGLADPTIYAPLAPTLDQLIAKNFKI